VRATLTSAWIPGSNWSQTQPILSPGISAVVPWWSLPRGYRAPQATTSVPTTLRTLCQRHPPSWLVRCTPPLTSCRPVAR
jgi:hypothetical protein